MNIAVDVMSGDKAPQELIKGCVDAANSYEVTVVIVGDETLIKSELKKYTFPHKNIEILPSEDIIGMCEAPSKAVRQKQKSSVVIAARSIKEKICSAMFSPGNTGATLAAALMYVGRIHGVKRPAIACHLPTTMGRPALLIDAGANVDSTPKYLVQFALMGEVYYRKIFNIPQPRVGLLNIGEEESKGNTLTIKSNQLLGKIPFHYIGNIESRYIFNGSIDVIVCDGFTGNMVLKQAEGMGKFFSQILRQEVTKNMVRKVGGLILKPGFDAIKSYTDASEYGGMPLLGIGGAVLIGHGSSDARAVKHAVKAAMHHVSNEVDSHIEEAVYKWGA